MTRPWPTGAAIAGGLAVAVVLDVGIALLGWNGPDEESAWHPLVGPIIGAVSSVLPGLIVGILSRHSGFVGGAVAGACGSIFVSALTATVYWPPFWDPDELTTHFMLRSVAYAVAAMITNGVAAVAGAHVAHGELHHRAEA